jgi:putative endonuclease
VPIDYLFPSAQLRQTIIFAADYSFWLRISMDRISDSDSEDVGSIPTGATKFYAYVIRSVNFQFLYKGHCENLAERLKQHNYGMTKSIKQYAPFELAYCEEFSTREEAIKREKYFKTAAGRRFLKSKIG